MGIGTILKWLGIGGLVATGTSVVAPGAAGALLSQATAIPGVTEVGTSLVKEGVVQATGVGELGKLSSAMATGGYALEQCESRGMSV